MTTADGIPATGLMIVTFAGCIAMAACEGYVSKEAAANVERLHKVALLPGYSDFKLVDSSADVGVAIFSYAYPARVTPSEVLRTLEAQIQKVDSCFGAVQRSAHEVQLRCRYARHGFAEYRVMTGGGRVTAMFADFGDPEEIASYPEYEKALQRAATPRGS
jgi:hypothetical protein